MEKRSYGYVRVSSKDQNTARQISAMREQGILERDIYIDKQTGKDFNREQYKRMKDSLRKQDVLYIHDLERFGRNKEEILQEWKDITRNIGADIVVLNMPLLDTTKEKDRMGSFVSDLVLQILSWIAEDERERIRKRQREGIDAARKNGVKFGRPRKHITNEFRETYRLWKNGDITAVRAMELCEVKKTTFYKWVKEIESEEHI